MRTDLWLPNIHFGFYLVTLSPVSCPPFPCILMVDCSDSLVLVKHVPYLRTSSFIGSSLCSQDRPSSMEFFVVLGWLKSVDVTRCCRH